MSLLNSRVGSFPFQSIVWLAFQLVLSSTTLDSAVPRFLGSASHSQFNLPQRCGGRPLPVTSVLELSQGANGPIPKDCGYNLHLQWMGERKGGRGTRVSMTSYCMSGCARNIHSHQVLTTHP